MLPKAATKREMLSAIAAMPMRFANLRAQFPGDVTVSDASSVGGGVVVICGLAAAGVAAAELCESVVSSRSGCHSAAWGEGWPTCGQSLAPAVGKVRLADIPTIPASSDSSPGEDCRAVGGGRLAQVWAIPGPSSWRGKAGGCSVKPCLVRQHAPVHLGRRRSWGERLALLWTFPTPWGGRGKAGPFVDNPHLFFRPSCQLLITIISTSAAGGQLRRWIRTGGP